MFAKLRLNVTIYTLIATFKSTLYCTYSISNIYLTYGATNLSTSTSILYAILPMSILPYLIYKWLPLQLFGRGDEILNFKIKISSPGSDSELSVADSGHGSLNIFGNKFLICGRYQYEIRFPGSDVGEQRRYCRTTATGIFGS